MQMVSGTLQHRCSSAAASCAGMSYLSWGPVGLWCGSRRSRCTAWSGRRSRGMSPREKTAASAGNKTQNRQQFYTKHEQEGWKGVNMWSHDRPSLERLFWRPLCLHPPSRLTFWAHWLSAAHNLNHWTAALINKPHISSCHHTPVATPQLFKPHALFWIRGLNHLVWE